ncbi:hypothetical protein RRF57_006908 [Xylaria bambusicola]|uniref:Uncharacterized protein n=1 Tax=Xylaria bambusicola TaxID=326684 RepID=A0AAN7Z9S5_9PEZI
MYTLQRLRRYAAANDGPLSSQKIALRSALWPLYKVTWYQSPQIAKFGAKCNAGGGEWCTVGGLIATGAGLNHRSVAVVR